MFNKPRIITIPSSEGISPVIGILLMVGVTVILALLIAVFVLDLGNSQSSPSTAGVEFSETADGVEVLFVVSGTAEEIEIVSDGTVLATWDSDDVGSRVTITGVSPTDSLVIRGTNGGSSTVIKNYVVQRPHSPSLTPQLVAGGGGGGGGGGVSPCSAAPTGALVVDSASGTDDGASPYQTVAAAVTDASSGDTIWVEDGTYTLGVLVDKDLTIATDCAVGVGSGAASQYAFYVASGAGVTVDGFELRDYGTVGPSGFNDSAILLSDSDGAALTARNLIVENSAAALNIRSSASLGTILLDNVSVQNTYSGVYVGSSDATGVTIRDSSISGAHTGIDYSYNSVGWTGTPLTIERTTIENSSQDGIYHTTVGSQVRIIDSQVINNGGDGFFHDISYLFTLQVENSVFENNGGEGIGGYYINADTSYIRDSSLASDELWFYYVFDSSSDPATLDAEQNWWGQSSGPTAGQITTNQGSIDTDPYCTVDCTNP